MITPISFLVVTEAALRLSGFGVSTDFFLKGTMDGREVWVSNTQFGRRFFPENAMRTPATLAVPVVKSTNSFRIFVFGESAALGDPLPRFGFSRLLERLLEDRFPGRDFEVINVAMTAINSHVILPIARECAGKSGDLWIIYMGNNEVVGPFGPGTTLGTEEFFLPAIRATLALKQTRLGQLLETVRHRLHSPTEKPAYWKGMELMAERKVRHDDPRMTAVYANFRRNLQDILRTGERAGVPVILSTVGVNQRDCPPFASLLSPDLEPGKKQRWEEGYAGAVALDSAGRREEALASYQNAAAIDETHAELQFRLATCRAALGRTNDLDAPLQLATDYDALRFRADSTINRIIRETAKQHSATLLDADGLFARNPDEQLQAGGKLFYEHVHFTPRGNYHLARVAAVLTETMLVRERPEWTDPMETEKLPNWLSQPECETRIGYVPWNHSQALRVMLDRFTLPPFPGTFDHQGRLQTLRAEVESAVAGNTPDALRQQAGTVQAAVASFPDDWELRENLGLLLSMAHDLPASVEQLRAAVRLMPSAPGAHFSLASVLALQGQTDEAIREYHESIRLEPNNFHAWVRLGIVELERRRFSEAVTHLQRAIAAKPDSISARMYLGGTFLQLKRNAEAVAQFDAVLRLEPNNAEAARMRKLAAG